MASPAKTPVPIDVEPTVPKVVAMHVPGGKAVRLGSLPATVLGRIATDHNVTVIQLVNSPLSEAISADALYRACCDRAGATAPDELSWEVIYDAVHLVDKPDPTQADQPTG